MDKRGKPLGVKIFSILQIIISIISIFIAIFLIYSERTNPGISSNLNNLGLGLVYFYSTMILIIILNIIGLVSGIGIFMLKSWARKLFISFALMIILYKIIDLILVLIKNIKGLSLIGAVLNLVVALIFYSLVLWYFNRTNIRNIFKI